MNPLKVFGAGLCSMFGYTIKNWKFILFAIFILAPSFFAAWCAVILGGGYLMYKGLIWLVMHIPPSWNTYLNEHHVGVAYSIVSLMMLYAIVLWIYKAGKDKLQKNEISRI